MMQQCRNIGFTLCVGKSSLGRPVPYLDEDSLRDSVLGDEEYNAYVSNHFRTSPCLH